mgnify:FL=1
MLFKNLKKVKPLKNGAPKGPPSWTTTKANNSWSKLNGAKLQSFARSFNKKQGVWEKCPCC